MKLHCDDSRIVIYDRNIFIMPDTGWMSEEKFNATFTSVSLHLISALLGPSTERERPPYPAFFVSTVKVLS